MQIQIATIVTLLAAFLPKFGVTLGNDELTAIVQALVMLGSTYWAWHERSKLTATPSGVGDRTVFGKAR